MASENRFFSLVLSLGPKKRKDRTLKLGRKWEGGGAPILFISMQLLRRLHHWGISGFGCNLYKSLWGQLRLYLH